MTEWVTLRVPESDRDDAKDVRPDDATHGDCLVAGANALAGNDAEGVAETTVEVTPELDQDALEELKNELSMVADPGTVLTDADVERMMDTLETVEERTGRLERLLEEVTGR